MSSWFKNSVIGFPPWETFRLLVYFVLYRSDCSEAIYVWGWITSQELSGIALQMCKVILLLHALALHSLTTRHVWPWPPFCPQKRLQWSRDLCSYSTTSNTWEPLINALKTPQGSYMLKLHQIHCKQTSNPNPQQGLVDNTSLQTLCGEILACSSPEITFNKGLWGLERAAFGCLIVANFYIIHSLSGEIFLAVWEAYRLATCEFSKLENEKADKVRLRKQPLCFCAENITTVQWIDQ